jgi:hypothetical protein
MEDVKLKADLRNIKKLEKLRKTVYKQGIGGKKIPYIDRVGGRVKLGL